jgi:hypothetical protein
MLNRSTLFDFDYFEICKSILLHETSFRLSIRDVVVISEKIMHKITTILVLALPLLLLSCSDEFYSFYKTHDEAVQDGALKRGWVPTILPTSSTEINEQHDLDTNEVWIRFNLSENEREEFTKSLRKLSHEEILKIDLRYPSRADWWFEGLIQKSPANDAALNADIYTISCDDTGKTGYLAIDCCSSHIYYWCNY